MYITLSFIFNSSLSYLITNISPIEFKSFSLFISSLDHVSTTDPRPHHPSLTSRWIKDNHFLHSTQEALLWYLPLLVKGPRRFGWTSRSELYCHQELPINRNQRSREGPVEESDRGPQVVSTPISLLSMLPQLILQSLLSWFSTFWRSCWHQAFLCCCAICPRSTILSFVFGWIALIVSSRTCDVHSSLPSLLLTMPTCSTLLSPPAPGSSWTDWSHAWGGEMRLRKALEKLNLEYPCDSDNWYIHVLGP